MSPNLPASPDAQFGAPAVHALTEPARRALDVHDPALFINRELSWLEFNARVLEEARESTLPVLDRLRFLSIFSSNLDEFFMVRVAGLKRQIASGVADTPADGLLPAEQLAAIAARTHELLDVQHATWREGILPALASAGLRIVAPADLSPEQRDAARGHFVGSVFPALTPLAVDPGHPFPHLRNKSLNVAVSLLRRDGRRRRRAATHLLAVVQVPAVLPRLVPLPSDSGEAYVLLEEIIAANVGDLFPGHVVGETASFRVTRNWDLDLDEEDSEDLLSTIQAELRRRDRGAAVRLEISAGASHDLEAALAAALKLEPRDVYRMSGPLQVADLLALDDGRHQDLRVEPFAPAIPVAVAACASMTDAIRRGDLLLHHPYDAFDPVVRFIEEAAEDPAVLAIKQTLYRTSGDSPFVRALSRAAENGKQVTVLVEIKARFDEANNIAWARRLEESGVHVVYGVIGLKTHCKVALVVRREADGIRRYVHLGTGNYNPTTARQYTDLSFASAREDLAADASALFNMLTGYAEPPRWKKLAVAPLGLQERLVALVGREADLARSGAPARIVAKMNALVDPVVIRALYAASSAGVEVDLLVRGICCLRAGVPGVSENIRSISVLGRFLEHSRVFAFGTGDRTEVYLSSADWMPRNFHRRVEVMFPIDDPALRARILSEILEPQLRADARAWRLQKDGKYVRRVDGAGAFDTQDLLVQRARRAAEPEAIGPVLRAVSPR